MKIDIKCQSEHCLTLDQLTEFQGNLKFRTDTDINRIANSIKEFGFSFPFFVWKDGETNNIIDGHGRFEALQALKSDGYEIPLLPVVYIKAKTPNEAKNILLRVNSLYGDIDRDELFALIKESEASIKDLSFLNIALDFDTSDFNISADETVSNSGEIYEPSLNPNINTDEVNNRDIEKAGEKLTDINKSYDYIEFICHYCGEKIFVKRETIIRYLKGEIVSG